MSAALSTRFVMARRPTRHANARVRWRPQRRWLLIGMLGLATAVFTLLCLRLMLLHAP